MSAHAAAPVAAPRRPFLALLLAVLSVPGSTLAWELPAGGFWIGVPLAVAAVVVGLRARPSAVATAAIVIAGAMLAMTIGWTLASLVS